MFCTVCEVVTTDLSHYKSQLHNLNVRRKLMGYTPLTVEEFDSDSRTDDLSVKLNSEIAVEAGNFLKVKNLPKACKKCMFCEQEDSQVHHREHGLSDEQAFYMRNLQCYICYEKFFETDLLIKHMDSNAHRTAVTDGVSLFLENGKILNPEKTQIPVKNVIAKQEFIKIPKIGDKIAEKAKESRESEKLAVSITNNRTWGKFLH